MTLVTQPITLPKLYELKQRQEKICCLTCYDATFAKAISECGIEVLLVGDTLGMVVQGHSSTLPVTVEDIVYHTKNVSRGNQGSWLIADMPFMSYTSPDMALHTAKQFMQAGAQMVKLEGGSWLYETIQSLATHGIPVCAHLGLTPQSVHKLGGYRVQGKTPSSAKQLIEDAKAIQNAGADMLVLECVPKDLAHEVTQLLTIPVIGIGAGPHVDGQILVLHDVLGIYLHRKVKFCQDFLAGQSEGFQGAIRHYQQAVKQGVFPHASAQAY